MMARRIVSLIPSATEIVCALGFEAQLVGRSHECDYPASVKRLPACTEPKFDPDGTSYAINQRVKAILQEALAVYRVQADVLKALQPDVIITQTQCEVCAVSLAEVERVTCEWLDSDAQIVALEPNSLEDVLADIERVAQALGVPERGEALVQHMRARMEAIAEAAREMADKPTVACIEWIDPLMAAGNWTPELVEMAGGVHLFGQAGQHAPWIQWEELVENDPDIIVIQPCGFDIARTLQDLPALTNRREWPALRAVGEGCVFIADGNQYFNRPGPRLVESLEMLAEMFHPNIFSFGHEGTGWRRL